jgi:hypothetical protein
MALGLVLALARWAPERLVSAVRWAAGTAEPPATEVRPPERKDPKSSDPEALRRQSRRRLRRARESDRQGGALRRSIEFTPEEVQALASDPQGPLGGRPAGLRVQLLDGRVKLSWRASPLDGPRWLAELIAVPMELIVEPGVESGKAVLPVRGVRAAGVLLPEWIARWLAPKLPAAPSLDAFGREALLPGLGGIEVHPGRLVLHPASRAPD